ncbi:MAG: hypothetical protein JJU27_12325 [Gammaproteobacteria bacterium]|nr:hypothetical protein [Gammaproteobacteria bacterium]
MQSDTETEQATGASANVEHTEAPRPAVAPSTGLVASFRESVAEVVESGGAGGVQWWLNYTVAYVIAWTLRRTLPVWSLLLAWVLGQALLAVAWVVVSPEAPMPDWVIWLIAAAVAVPVLVYRRAIVAGTDRAFDACMPLIEKIIGGLVALMWFAFYIYLVWLFATKVLFGD